MGPLGNIPSQQKIANHFLKQLEDLAHPGILTGHLIVREKGSLSQTNVLRFLWEKLKGFLGFRNGVNASLVEFKTLQFLIEGRSWLKEGDINNPKCLENIEVLAKRAGLISSNSENSSQVQTEVQALVKEIFDNYRSSQREKTDELLRKLDRIYENKLGDFPEDIRKINGIFHRIHFLPDHPPVEFQSTEEQSDEGSPNFASQEDSSRDGHSDSNKVIAIETVESPKAEDIPLAVASKADHLQLLEIPESKDLDLSKEPVTGPQFPSETESAEVSAAATPPQTKVQALTPDKIKTASWTTARKVAAVAAGAFVLTAAYFAWKYLSTVNPEVPVIEDINEISFPTETIYSDSIPSPYTLVDTVVSAIYPPPEDLENLSSFPPGLNISPNQNTLEQLYSCVVGTSPISNEQISPESFPITPFPITSISNEGPKFPDGNSSPLSDQSYSIYSLAMGAFSLLSGAFLYKKITTPAPALPSSQPPEAKPDARVVSNTITEPSPKTKKEDFPKTVSSSTSTLAETRKSSGKISKQQPIEESNPLSSSTEGKKVEAAVLPVIPPETLSQSTVTVETVIGTPNPLLSPGTIKVAPPVIDSVPMNPEKMEQAAASAPVGILNPKRIYCYQNSSHQALMPFISKPDFVEKLYNVNFEGEFDFQENEDLSHYFVNLLHDFNANQNEKEKTKTEFFNLAKAYQLNSNILNKVQLQLTLIELVNSFKQTKDVKKIEEAQKVIKENKITNLSSNEILLRISMQLTLIKLFHCLEQKEDSKIILNAAKDLCDVLFSTKEIPDFTAKEKYEQQDAVAYLNLILKLVLNYQHTDVMTRTGCYNGKLYSSPVSKTESLVKIELIGEKNDLQEFVDAFYFKNIYTDNNNTWHYREDSLDIEFNQYEQSVKTLGEPKDLLVLHLDRGVQKHINDPGSINRRKITCPKGGILDFSKAHGREVGSLKYQVKSFILLLATNPTSGHYTSYVKKGDQWYYCNDDKVTAVSSGVAEANMSDAYVLFLEKVKDEEVAPIESHEESIGIRHDADRGIKEKELFPSGMENGIPDKKRETSPSGTASDNESKITENDSSQTNEDSASTSSMDTTSHDQAEFSSANQISQPQASEATDVVAESLQQSPLPLQVSNHILESQEVEEAPEVAEPVVLGQQERDSLPKRIAAGLETLKKLKREGKLTYRVRSVFVLIEDADYIKFIEKNVLDEPLKVISTFLKIQSCLDGLKQKGFEKLKEGSFSELEKELQGIHNAILALNSQKELFFETRLKNSTDQNISKVFDKLQNLVGKDLQISVDLKIALFEMLSAKNTSDKFSTYLDLARSVRYSTLKNAETLISLNEIFMSNFSDIINNEFLPALGDFSGPPLCKAVYALQNWILAKVGFEFNTQPVTDAIELALSTKESPTETKETKRELDALNDEKFQASFMMPEEKALALRGFRTHGDYAIKVKNEWKTNKNPSLINWSGTFAAKKNDGSYNEAEAKGSIDFTEIEVLNSEVAKKAALKFVWTYCQSGKQTREKLDKWQGDPLDIPDYLRLALYDQADFWDDLQRGKGVDLSILQKVQSNFKKLIEVSNAFAKQIDQAMIKAFVDSSQESSSFNEISADSIEQLGLSSLKGNDVSDEEDNDPLAGFVFVGNELMSDLKEDLSGFEKNGRGYNDSQVKAVQSSGSYLAAGMEALWGFGQGTVQALSSMASYIPIPVIALPKDPEWVAKKYELAVSQVLDHIKKNEKLIPIVEENKWTSDLGKLVGPLFTQLKDLSARDAHTLFLGTLRTALSSKSYQGELAKKNNQEKYDPLVDVVLSLCKGCFEEAYLYSYCEELIKKILSKRAASGVLSDADFVEIEAVDQKEKLSVFEVNAKKLQGHLNINFDPHLQGNIPFVLGIVNIANKAVKLLRMGTPTIEGGVWSTAEINPEFKGYVNVLKLENKKHLYISLQNDKKKGSFTGDESGRNGAIKGLAKEFPENFFAVVLAQDSNFYKQVDSQGKDLGDENANDFKADFFKQLVGINTGFYFPDTWKQDPQFKLGLKKLLEDVQEAVYPGKEALTRQEKQDFIEIYYAYLALFLMNYSEADNVNITCKDAIDRAGKLNSLVLQLIMTIQGRAGDKDYQRKHQVLTHAPAFLVKAQAIIGSRRNRLMSAFGKMTEPEVRERIKKENIQVALIDPNDPKKTETIPLIDSSGSIDIK